MIVERNPETSAACQLLYAAMDTAPTDHVRQIAARAIARLSGHSLDRVFRQWEATR